MPGDNGEDELFEQNEEDRDTRSPEQVREDNRESERGWAQTIYDGLRDAKEGVSSAVTTENQETADTAERAAEAESEMHSAQEQMVDEFQDLGADAARTKTGLEQDAVETDEALHQPEDVADARINYENSVEGGEVAGDFSFGLYESIVNTEFLASDVVRMRNVEDDSYTQGDRAGRSLPFIEEADIADSDAKSWAQRFNSDFQSASDQLGQFVDHFNLDDRKEAYEAAVADYEQTEEFEDRLEEIEEAAQERGLEAVNELISGSYEELEDEHLEQLQDTIADVGGHMNDREDGLGSINLEHDERANAEELVRQTRARALDRAALHKQRLDEAREEISEVYNEIEGTREEVESYVDQVEDLTAVEGVGDSFADVLEDMGVETVMDMAARNDYESNAAYQEKKRNASGSAVPDADELREAAFDYMNEVAADMDHLDLVPTDTIRDVGDDYSDEDQRRRQFEAVYDSSTSLVNVMNELEKELPELDQYDVGWDGEEETLEEEREEVYQNLGIEHPTDPEEALGSEHY